MSIEKTGAVQGGAAMRSLSAFIFVFVLLTSFVAAPAKPLRQQGKVQIHHEAIVNGIRVKFVDLIEDSRCPTDTQCVWAGNAKLKVKLWKNGQTRVVEMNTGMEPRVIRFAGYEIKITDLTPHPATNIRIRKDGYVATFSVVRKR
jgi:hypothetical protein